VPLLLAQARLAARTSSFLEYRFASGTILLHPAGHGLTDHFHLAGDLGLIPPLFEQANGLEAAFLSDSEISHQFEKLAFGVRRADYFSLLRFGGRARGIGEAVEDFALATSDFS